MHNHKGAFEILFEHEEDRFAGIDAITVAVSLFNYARFIDSCLDSVAAQTHERLELIVVDDMSSADDSASVAETWMRANQSRFGRVSLLRHMRNSGLAEARNTAFRYARTDPVFVMDADNEVYPRCMERLIEFVRYREYDAAYTQLEFFGNERRLGYADVWNRERFRRSNYVDAMALISRRAWSRVKGYRHLEGGWEDYDLWCTFIEAGMRSIFVPEILGRYRVHGSSMLRTETVNAEGRLVLEMSARHPWLRLGY